MPLKDKEEAKRRQKLYSKNWYEKNKKQHQAGVKKNKKEAREKWVAYKSSQKCSHCGFSHPAVIDFHHVIRKDKQSVHRLAAMGAYKKAQAEAEEKCIPLCANCHRILHFDEICDARAAREKKAAKKAAKKPTQGEL